MKETEKARNAKGKPGKCGDTGAKRRMLRRGGLTVPAFSTITSPSFLILALKQFTNFW